MSSMISTMYQDTLTNLYAGVVSAIDREVLSYSPLPSNIVDPYASQDVDPANTMNLTYSAMVVWIEEAKKADYFSKHFVTLSRMIMNGTTTMARGLVTMHGRGENLSSAPMSIGDLISLSSYHFRKSYLGVIQTAKSKPEISERLLLNQLGWCNTLMRLYKTKEKLEKGVDIAVPQCSETQLPENHQENAAIEETKTAGQLNERPESAALTMTAKKADQGVSALREPGSFAAPGAYNVIRAFTSFDHQDSNSKKSSRELNAAGDKKENAAVFDRSKKSSNDETLLNGNESGLPETVRSEKTDREQENQPGKNVKTEAEVRTSEKENMQKEISGTKEIVTDFPKTDKPETVPDTQNRDTEENAADGTDIEHTGADSAIPAEDDLTEPEKMILSDARKYPDYLFRLRMNAADPDFRVFLPRLSASYRKVLAVIDST